MKKIIFYFCLMMFIGIIGILMWEVSPVVAEHLGVSVRLTDAMAYMMAIPYIIAGGLFTSAIEEKERKNS